MKIAANTAFKNLAANFHRLERLGDINKLNAFMASATYEEQFAALRPDQKGKVGSLTAQAFIKAQSKLKPIPRYSQRGWRAWDDARIALLVAAERKTGSDEGIARALGISYNAAKAARRRYIGNRVEVVGGGILRQAA